ncbi:hypothetical protein V7652_15130 [Bacillus thuringiensis]|uniref:LMxysn_1693 family intestinal colonization protein n=1 Tax=Bacillus cereus group TaxID=86661 RepID=UPI000BF785F2|nr:hypothetical protein [Bacillus thuringiensis]KAB2364046.1 hypothetical protein F8517_26190 [Bacillus thuringiensis]PFA77772.1 hypothetical protein CN400_29400 [Bacillus thuringiensis]PFE87116.1 hypothetical protein CN321_25785 [Bacillus thuringiensis]
MNFLKKKVIPTLLVGGILAGGSFVTNNAYAAEVNPSNETNSIKPLCATCNQYKGYIKYSNTLSHEYLGTVTKTSGYATNTGFTVYGISFGGGKTYSESRNFKEYRVKRQYYMHFDVYNGAGQKIDSFDTTRTETTIEYERA